jgi:hypothetical protein
MAMMIGWVLSRHREAIASDRVWVWAILACFALEAVAAVAVLVSSATGLEASLTGLKVVSDAWHDWYAWVACGVALLAVTLAVRWRSRLIGGVRLSVATSLTVVVASAIHFGFGVPLFAAADRYGPISTGINQLVPAGLTTYMFRPEREAFLFRVHPPVRYIQTPEQIGPNVRYMIVGDRFRNTPGLNEALARRAGRLLCKFECKRGKFDLLELGPGTTSGPTSAKAAGPASGPAK